jgi:hypothetical protein
MYDMSTLSDKEKEIFNRGSQNVDSLSVAEIEKFKEIVDGLTRGLLTTLPVGVIDDISKFIETASKNTVNMNDFLIGLSSGLVYALEVNKHYLPNRSLEPLERHAVAVMAIIRTYEIELEAKQVQKLNALLSLGD